MRDGRKQFYAGALLHQRIQNDIVNDIVRGVYEKGAIIPNQESFSRKYGVSRATVRKATDRLIESGVLVSVKGKGTFVCDYGENVHQIFGSTTFDEAMKVRARLTSKTLTVRRTTSSRSVAKHLGLTRGDGVVHIERVRLLGVAPYAYQISYLDSALLGNITLDKESLDRNSLFKLLEVQCGLMPAYQDEEIRAVGCAEHIAHCLQMEPQAPVVQIFRTVYTQNGRVMEYCEDYERTDHKAIHVRTFARHTYGKG